jgi:hypothetical protein
MVIMQGVKNRKGGIDHPETICLRQGCTTTL